MPVYHVIYEKDAKTITARLFDSAGPSAKEIGHAKVMMQADPPNLEDYLTEDEFMNTRGGYSYAYTYALLIYLRTRGKNSCQVTGAHGYLINTLRNAGFDTVEEGLEPAVGKKTERLKQKEGTEGKKKKDMVRVAKMRCNDIRTAIHHLEIILRERDIEIVRPDEIRTNTISSHADAPTRSHYCCCCYITTSTCLALGIPDNGDELMTLRWFRDNIVIKSKQGKHEIQEYYQTAPKIISGIDKSPNAKQTYLNIYENYISPAVFAIKDKKFRKAYQIYKLMVKSLERQYLQLTTNRK